MNRNQQNEHVDDLQERGAMAENQQDDDDKFERFSAASLSVQLWLERWHQGPEGVPFTAAVARETAENARRDKRNSAKAPRVERARIAEFFKLLKTITIEIWHHIDIIYEMQPRIIRADPAGSAATVPAYSPKWNGDFSPGIAATAHAGAIAFLQGLALRFWEGFSEAHQASWEFETWDDELVGKFITWLKDQSLPTAEDIAARIIRERAYVEEFSRSPRLQQVLNTNESSEELKSRIINSIAAAGPTHTLHRIPADWQGWLQRNNRPNSPTSWRKFKGLHHGEDHPVSGDHLVRFPVKSLLDDGLQPPIEWLPSPE